jgi:1-deoxy-D-xylulose 5-phosphate reductoisomerase
MSDQPKGQPGQTGSAGQSAVETAAEATERVTNAGLSVAEQFSKRIAEMQLFAMPDMDAVTTAHRRNMEALSAAYRPHSKAPRRCRDAMVRSSVRRWQTWKRR